MKAEQLPERALRSVDLAKGFELRDSDHVESHACEYCGAPVDQHKEYAEPIKSDLNGSFARLVAQFDDELDVMIVVLRGCYGLTHAEISERWQKMRKKGLSRPNITQRIERISVQFPALSVLLSDKK